MMWYGRMTFRLKGRTPETGREETRSAILLIYALQNAQVNGQPALQAWSDLYAPTVFFVGRSDDLTVIQYGDVSDMYMVRQPMCNLLWTKISWTNSLSWQTSYHRPKSWEL